MKQTLSRNPAQRPAAPLFDNTRDQSLYELRASGKIDQRQQQVLGAMQEIGKPCSMREMAAHLHWPINCVTGRVAELRDDLLLIEKYGKAKDKDTGVTNNLYRIIPR